VRANLAQATTEGAGAAAARDATKRALAKREAELANLESAKVSTHRAHCEWASLPCFKKHASRLPLSLNLFLSSTPKGDADQAP
jgi:hypothetical protein